MPVARGVRKGRSGRKKRISTEGYFCPNKSCEYYGITDERIHALVGYGTHGKQEVIPDLKCQGMREEVHGQAKHGLVSAENCI
jgi:hypothetical protein